MLIGMYLFSAIHFRNFNNKALLYLLYAQDVPTMKMQKIARSIFNAFLNGVQLS